ncbi:MAG TPA: ISAzo13 family transposase [Streptosporangiaceae bacterium]|nr:ISAzo13 family transposase [Streptosporangiaceae bacterium]
MLAAKFGMILPHLDERQRRLLLGSEARALGRGGIRLVAQAAGVREATVSLGAAELTAGGELPGRVRRPGGGRKRSADLDPGLVPALLALVEPEERGDPESPLRWTVKSTRTLAAELARQGHEVSAGTVAGLLRGEGFSLQGNAKVIEGTSHPDRNAQFRYINGQVKAFQAAGEPVISVDSKKKEMVGDFGNAGRQWRPKGSPARVRDHDFACDSEGKAIPYGIYDLTADAGWVSVGTDHDTAAFAVETIRRWWNARGSLDYPGAGRLLVTADGGGANGTRPRAWKKGLAAFALEAGLEVTVCHFPPGTSKWNKIEHRLFSHITMNWRGRPLTSHEVVVSSIAATTTRTGLTVHAELDPGSYPAGEKVSDAEMDALPLARHDWHGDWNYTLRPEPPAPPPPAPPPGPGHAAWARPALTGLTPAAWDQLTAALHAAAGEPPPIHLSLADQALITILRLRFQVTNAALARLYAVSASTIRTAQDHAWPLLVHAGYPTEPAGPALKTLPELTAHAREHGITLTPKTNGLFLRSL